MGPRRVEGADGVSGADGIATAPSVPHTVAPVGRTTHDGRGREAINAGGRRIRTVIE